MFLRFVYAQILVCMLLTSPWVSAAGSAVDTVAIQGLGTIQLSESDNTDRAAGQTRLQCQSVEQARVLHAKLYDDLTWDTQCGLQLLDQKSSLPILGYPGAGVGNILLGRHDTTVYVLSAPSAKVLTDASQQLQRQGQTLSFDRIERYPAILNFTDLAPLYQLYHQMGRKGDLKGSPIYSEKAMRAPYDFWKKFGINMGVNLRTYFGFDNHFDAKPETFAIENEMRIAEQHDMPYYIWIGPHQIPWWMRWRFPDDMAQPDPYAVPTWIPNGFLGGGNLSMEASDEAFDYVHRYNLQMIQMLKEHGPDHMSALRLAIGRPGDELGMHLFSTELMDHSPAGQRGFRKWLQENRHVDLEALGKRWHGDTKQYASWDQVRLPSLFSFFGDFGEDSFELLTDWNWRTYQPKLDSEKWWEPTFDARAAKWRQVDLAPSMDQLFAFGSELDKTQRQGQSTIACMRKTFIADDWITQHPNQRVYLVINSYNAKPIQVYFNGMDLGLRKANERWRGPVGLDVTSLIKRGANTLAMSMPEGRILGPVFLTTHRPGYYPYDDPHKNARWVDMRDYVAQSLMDGYLRMVSPIQNQFVDWPILFNVGSSFNVADQYLRVKQQVGVRAIHNTGSEASYRPWWPGLGYVIGAYGSSEESGHADATKLGRELGWLLLNAESTHSFVYDAALYQEVDEKTGWFTKNKRLWQLMGKYVWRKPQVAIFRSSKGSLYYPYQDEQHSWDLGRGSLQRVHYNNVYVTESELHAGLAGDYPVIIDCNNPMLTQQAIDDLKQYVQQGGTYVVLQQTGRHDPLNKDAWPIQQLTGCKVIGDRRNMMVQVPADNPLLSTLAGKTFKGDGAAINWVGDNYAQNSVALEPSAEVAQQFKPIAIWEDGTIAAGVRQLGKGRVVVLGSTFWRSSSDRSGKGIYLQGDLEAVFLSDLLKGLGLKPQVQTDNPDIWARRMITKNGTQQWFVLYNSMAGPIKQVSMSFALDHDPGTVFNVVTGKPVAYRYEEGKVILPAMDFDSYQTTVFGIWENNFDHSVSQWYQIKAKFEKTPDVQGRPNIDAKRLPPAQMLVLDQFDFYQLKPDEQVDPQWLMGAKPSKPWQTVRQGFWGQMGFSHTGKAVYHTTVNIPDAWQGRNLIMVMATWNGPVFLGHADLYANGKQVGDYRERGWSNNESFDLTSTLKPGVNHIALIVESNDDRGGFMGQIGLYAQKPMRDVIDIKRAQLVQNDFESSHVSLPMSKRQGRYLAFEVDVPSDWDAKQTYLELVAEERTISTVRVNGRPINYHQYLHPFPRHTQINLSPWIKPGQRNQIELWPFNTIPFHNDKPRSALTPFDMQSIRMGTLIEGASEQTVEIKTADPKPLAMQKATPVMAAAMPQPIVVDAKNDQPTDVPQNLLDNSSFETHGTFEQMQVQDHVKRQQDTKAVQVDEQSWAKNWQPGCQAYEKDIALTGSISVDQSIATEGQASLKIHNDSLTDITYVAYRPDFFKGQDQMLPVKPNHRYRLTWQVKGQNIKPNGDGIGPIMMMYYLTIKDGKQTRVNMYTREKSKGDFDWTARQFDFTTDANAQFAMFSFQLRRASGTIWYDNIKLEDMGPVVAVESF